MNAKDIALLALALRSTRPIDVFTNRVTRRQWYADVSAIAEAIRKDKGDWFNNARASKFFDDCGVPS